MRVVLTDRLDAQWLQSRSLVEITECDCDCDCDCACPTDDSSISYLKTPVAYYLELTPVCNNRCPGCGNLYAAQRQALSRALDGVEWVRLIRDLSSHAYQFRLTGGEPTLHPAFAQIIQTIETVGIPFRIFSNARWSHPAQMIRLLTQNKRLEGLLISLHGPDAVTHDAFSGVPGSFAETTANIQRAVAAGLDVAASMVITTHNWHLVPETLATAQSLGVNHLVCNRLIEVQPAPLSPDQRQLRHAVRKINELRQAGLPIRFGNCIPQCFELSSSVGCMAGSTFATVDPWGRVRPCNHAPLLAGDLRSQAIGEIWNGPVMRYWRQLTPSACAACAAYSACRGGCRAQALLSEETHDPLMRQPLPAQPGAEKAPELSLYAGLRPVIQGDRRLEENQIYLVCKGRVTRVPLEYQAHVACLDGTLTLAQIKDFWGDQALDWIGDLYQRAFIDWS